MNKKITRHGNCIWYFTCLMPIKFPNCSVRRVICVLQMDGTWASVQLNFYEKKKKHNKTTSH